MAGRLISMTATFVGTPLNTISLRPLRVSTPSNSFCMVGSNWRMVTLSPIFASGRARRSAAMASRSDSFGAGNSLVLVSPPICEVRTSLSPRTTAETATSLAWVKKRVETLWSGPSRR